VIDTCDQRLDDLAAYAVGSLDDRERADLEAHVATCPTCARQLRAYRAVVDVLPLALEPAVPPPAAWATIRSTVRQREAARDGGRRRPILRDWLRVATLPAAAAIAASLLVWNVALQRELARYTSGPQVDALARRPGRLVILSGKGTPGASARLLVAMDGGHGHLAVAGLRPLPSGRTYQLWFVRPAGPAISGGTFMVDSKGRAWASIDPPASLDEVRVIMVTEEPAPGSAAPTGPDLLDAQQWR
jgi:anti-sigma-K factor RskA